MNKIFFKVAFLVLFISCISIYENNFGILFFSFLWILLGIYFIRISFNKTNFNVGLDLFFFFYSLYYIYAFLISIVYIHNPFKDYFLGIDSIKYYGFTDEIIKESHSISGGFKIIFGSFKYSGVDGYLYPHFLIGYFAGIIDKNSYFIQQSFIVLLASLVIVFCYKLALNFLNKDQAKIIAIVYGCLGHIFVYSSTLLRDIHMAFLFILGFVILFNKRTIWGFLKICIINFLIYVMRPEHGIYFILFLMFYLFLLVKDNKKRPIRFIPAILISLFFVSFLIFNLNIAQLWNVLTGTTTRYASFAESSADPSGLGMILLKLPPGIQQLARTAFSQIFPFPSYSGVNTSLGVVKILAFPIIFSAILWVIVWGFIIYGFRIGYFRKHWSDPLTIVFILSFLLIVGASSGSGDVRRLIPVYPIIIIFSGVLFFKFPKQLRIKIAVGSFFIYFCLHLVYLYLKY